MTIATVTLLPGVLDVYTCIQQRRNACVMSKTACSPGFPAGGCPGGICGCGREGMAEVAECHLYIRRVRLVILCQTVVRTRVHSQRPPHARSSPEHQVRVQTDKVTAHATRSQQPISPARPPPENCPSGRILPRLRPTRRGRQPPGTEVKMEQVTSRESGRRARRASMTVGDRPAFAVACFACCLAS